MQRSVARRPVGAAPGSGARRAAIGAAMPRTGRPRPAAAMKQQSAAAEIPNGRQPFFNVFKQLTRPAEYFRDVLRGRDYARGQFGVFNETVFIGSDKVARELLGAEERTGIQIGWGPALVKLIGVRSLSMTPDAADHARQRAMVQPFFSPDAVAAKMPGVQATARRYMSEWLAASAADGGFKVYPGMKRFTFDVLVNQVLELGLSEAEVAELSALFQVWVGGFLPPDIELPFTPIGRGMAARAEIRDRILARIASGRLPPDGLVVKLQEFFEGEEAGVVDNIINIMFAGHDTSSSSLTSLFDLFASNPDALARLASERAAVVARHGPELTPAAVADMPYATAAIRESLRLRPIVPGVMRKAGKDIPLPGGATIPAGCPVAVAFSSMAEREPAWQADWEAFKPERFLTATGVTSGGGGGGGVVLSQPPAGYNPFGVGVRYCLGSHLAMAEMQAMLAELGALAATHALEADRPDSWTEFPILVPNNGLPARLVPKSK